MTPFDWFLLATPFFALLVLLSLITLKMALSAVPTITSTQMQKLRTEQTQRTQTLQKTGTSKYQIYQVLQHLIRNYSVFELCLTKKAKNKLTTLLSISVIAFLCFNIPSIYIHSVAGIPISLIFIIGQCCLQNDQLTINTPTTNNFMEAERQDFNTIQQNIRIEQRNKSRKIKYFYSMYSILACGLSLFLCGITFKNYSNLFLSNLLKNTAVNSIFDLLLLRPVFLLILSLPLSFIPKIHIHIENQKIKQNYSIIFQSQKNQTITNINPQPPIQPDDIRNQPPKKNNNNLKNFMHNGQPRLKLHKIIDPSQIKSATRKPKKQIQTHLQSNSFNNLIQSKPPRKNTPMSILQEQTHQSKTFRNKKKDSDLIIVEFKKNQRNKNNNNQEHIISDRPPKFLHSNLDFQSHQNRNTTVLGLPKNKKHLHHKPEHLQQNQHQKSQHNNHNYNNHHQPPNDKYEALRINNFDRKHKHYDSNSPNKSKSHHHKQHQQQNHQHVSHGKQKTSRSNKSNSKHKRMIKFSKGDPYLEYLPNMLKDKDKNKKSLPNTNTYLKDDPPEQLNLRKKRKSYKKISHHKQKNIITNNENQEPATFWISDL